MEQFQIRPVLGAVGYFFGRELHSKLNVPIGLISSTWGGSAAEAWTSRDVLDADPAYSDILERHNADLKKFKSFKNIVSAFKQWESEYVQWTRDDKQAKKWMSGEDFEVENKLHGFIIIKNKDDFLGCGRVVNGKLLNYVPKERRVNL